MAPPVSAALFAASALLLCASLPLLPGARAYSFATGGSLVTPAVPLTRGTAPRYRQLCMRVSGGKSGGPGGAAGSRLTSENLRRIRSAGRRGTKNFVDPNKIFVGNLPYDASEAAVWSLIREHGGYTDVHVVSIKVIRDWRSKKSKGYAFVQFSDPIFATGAMQTCQGKPIGGRPVQLRQGAKKQEEGAQVYKVERGAGGRAVRRGGEEGAILAGLEEAATDPRPSPAAAASPSAPAVPADPSPEAGSTWGADDTGGELEDGYSAVWDDSDMTDPPADDDNFEYDGVYVEEYEGEGDGGGEGAEELNRQERREKDRETRKRRRVKLGKGFGTAAAPGGIKEM